MPEVLTCRETPQSIADRVAGFKSEWWPTSNRNDGRLRVGIPGRLQSESALECFMATNLRQKKSKRQHSTIGYMSSIEFERQTELA